MESVRRFRPVSSSTPALASPSLSTVTSSRSTAMTAKLARVSLRAEVNWLYLDTTGSPRGAEMLFGLAVRPGNKGIYFVDDGQHRLNVSIEHMPTVGAAKPSPLPPQALGLPGQVRARPDCPARRTGAQGATGACRSGGRSGHRL